MGQTTNLNWLVGFLIQVNQALVFQKTSDDMWSATHVHSGGHTVDASEIWPAKPPGMVLKTL